jgi:hypothetical protein
MRRQNGAAAFFCGAAQSFEGRWRIVRHLAKFVLAKSISYKRQWRIMRHLAGGG